MAYMFLSLHDTMSRLDNVMSSRKPRLRPWLLSSSSLPPPQLEPLSRHSQTPRKPPISPQLLSPLHTSLSSHPLYLFHNSLSSHPLNLIHLRSPWTFPTPLSFPPLSNPFTIPSLPTSLNPFHSHIPHPLEPLSNLLPVSPINSPRTSLPQTPWTSSTLPLSLWTPLTNLSQNPAYTSCPPNPR